MKPHALLTTALVALSTVAASSAANASVFSLPDAIGITDAYTAETYVLNSGVPSSSVTSSPYGESASAFVSGGPYPLVESTAMGNNPSDAATASLNYYTEVIGAPNTYVPVYIQGAISGTIENYGITDSQVGLADGSKYLFRQTLSTTTSRSERFDQRVMLPTDVALQIYLYTSVASWGGNVSATADPFLFIDPNFAGANQYSLAFSNGITNAPVSGVPLPASLPMFAALIAGMVGFTRFRKQRSGFALAD